MFMIYKLTSPDGKVYIGCTSHAKLEHRFGFRGEGYRGQPYIWPAIQKFGWENFKHEAIATAESREEASELERYYINKYDSTNLEKGYNKRPGGIGAPMRPVPPEVGRRISQSKKGSVGIIKGDEYRVVPVERLDALLSEGWRLGGRPLPEEQKQHLREINTGKLASAETRAKLSAARRGKRVMHKGDTEYKVAPEDIDRYLAEGYELGRSPIANQHNREGQLGKKHSEETRAKRSVSMMGKMAGRCQINKDGVRKLVPKDQVEAFLADGWKLGVGPRKKASR